jgi:glyoxylase-like metal-dependent hydrolase (beta-lactamase superfamily II)
MVKSLKVGPITILFGRLPAYPHCNTVWIRGRENLLVDPACDEMALRELAKNGNIEFLFNTHYHPDHIRYNGLFPKAKWLAHGQDAPCLRSLDSMAEWVGVKGTRWEKEWRRNLLENFGFRERETIQEIQDGDSLDLGGVTLQWIHLPGHTPGHTGFWLPEWKVCFLGDMELSPIGPWYGNRKACIDQIIQSIDKIHQIAADLYIPAHGDPVSAEEIHSRLERYRQNIYRREEKILRALATPQTLDALTTRSLISGLRLEPHSLWYHFEKTMIEKHLERLRGQGKVIRMEDRWVRTISEEGAETAGAANPSVGKRSDPQEGTIPRGDSKNTGGRG